MDIRNYFYFLWRIKFKALACGVIFALVGGLYSAFFIPTTYEGLIFMSVGMEQAVYPEDAESYGARGVSEADNYFSETVQGWTMDPSFVTQVVERLDGYAVSVSARKQERQNVIFQVGVLDEDKIAPALDAVVAEVQDRLDSYNGTIKTTYAMANVEFTTYAKEPRVAFNGLVGFIVGFLLVMFYYLIFEYLRGIVTFPYQAEEILGKKSLGCCCNNTSVFKPFSDESTLLLGVGSKVCKGLEGKRIDFDELKKGDYLLCVKMGEAKEKDLMRVMRFADKIDWIVS